MTRLKPRLSSPVISSLMELTCSSRSRAGIQFIEGLNPLVQLDFLVLYDGFWSLDALREVCDLDISRSLGCFQFLY